MLQLRALAAVFGAAILCVSVVHAEEAGVASGANLSAPPSQEFSREADTDRPGNDIRGVPVNRSDVPACERICSAETGCAAFTLYSPPNDSRSYCWIKKAAGTSKYSPGTHVSGVRRAPAAPAPLRVISPDEPIAGGMAPAAADRFRAVMAEGQRVFGQAAAKQGTQAAQANFLASNPALCIEVANRFEDTLNSGLVLGKVPAEQVESFTRVRDRTRADSKTWYDRFKPAPNLMKAAFEKVGAMSFEEVNTHIQKCVQAGQPQQNSTSPSAAPTRPVAAQARPATLHASWEPGGSAPFYPFMPDQKGFYYSFTKDDPADRMRREIPVLQMLQYIEDGAYAIQHLFSANCTAKTLWWLEMRYLGAYGAVVRTAKGSAAAAPPKPGLEQAILDAACAAMPRTTLAGSYTQLLANGLGPRQVKPQSPNSVTANGEKPPLAFGNPATWITQDDYPTHAMRSGFQGKVVARLMIGTDGRVKSCTHQTPSGYAELDTATCALLTARARYQPARDKAGNPIAWVVIVPIDWRLP